MGTKEIALVVFLLVIARLLYLYLIYKQRYHKNEAWKVLWDYRESDETIYFWGTKTLFDLLMKNAKMGKISKPEIQKIKNEFFYIFDDKIAHRIRTSMNIENEELPSLKEIFPEGYQDFPFEEVCKKENLFTLIEEFEDITSFIEPTKGINSKFTLKLNDYIVPIFNKVRRHLDLSGRISAEGVIARYDCFIKTIKSVHLVESEVTAPLIKELERGRLNFIKYKQKNKKPA